MKKLLLMILFTAIASLCQAQTIDSRNERADSSYMYGSSASQKQLILSNNKTAGEYLTRASNRQLASLGFAAVGTGFFLWAMSEDADVESKTSTKALYGVSAGFGVISFVLYICAWSDIKKAGWKLNEHTTIGFTNTGVGATVKF